MNKFWIFLLFLGAGCSSSKKVVLTQAVEVEAKHLAFAKLSNQADLAVLDSNLVLAINLYREAFSVMEVDYVAPYYNAYRAAKEIGDCEMSFYTAKHLLGFGAWIEHFQKDECLADNDYLWAEIEDTYMVSQSDNDYLEIIKSIENQLFTLYDNRMVLAIQALKSSGDTVAIKMGKFGTFTEGEKKYKLDSLTTVFLDLVAQKGFPTERRLGAEWSMAGLSIQQYRRFAPMYQYSKKVRIIFDEAFAEGFISPGEYAMLDSTQVYFISPFFYYGKPPVRYVYDFSETEKKSINARRLNIGLPKLEQQLKFYPDFDWVHEPYYYPWLGESQHYEWMLPKHRYRIQKTECGIDSRTVNLALKALYHENILRDLDLGDTIYLNLGRELSSLEVGFPKLMVIGKHQMIPKFGLSGSPLISLWEPSYSSSKDSIRTLKYHVKYRPGCDYHGEILFRCVDEYLIFHSIPWQVGPECE